MKFEEPLRWNPCIPRTKRQERSRFGNRSAYRAGEDLSKELTRMGAKNIIISSDLRQKPTGGFYANQNRIEDVGVCIYFNLKDVPKVFACDKWDRVEDNLWALKLNVGALRGMDRWGGSNFMDGLFTGFKALPPHDPMITPPTQFFMACRSKEDAKSTYHSLAKKLHPDLGGSKEEFSEMQRQYSNLPDRA